MELMTKEIEKRFKEVGSQEKTKDPLVIVKFFNPTGAGTWFATEYDPKEKLFFGFVQIFGGNCDEWGYFGLEELKSIKSMFGLGIERDLHIREPKISEIMPKAVRS